jgi:zinc protease
LKTGGQSLKGRLRGPALLSLAALASALLAGLPDTPRPERIVLATGQECLFQRDSASSITVVEIFVPGGRNAVPPGKDGLAYLATRIALEIPDFTVAQDIMAQATRMSLAVLEDCSVISIECLSDNLEPALRVASEIVQKPLITGLRIDNIKRTMDLFAKAEGDDAADTGHAAALSAFFQGRGYGSSNYGTEASRKAIEKKDVTGFFNRQFTRNGISYSVCSDLDRGRVQALLEKYFAGFPSGDAPSPPPPSAAVPSDRRVNIERDFKQSYVARAYLLPAASGSAFAKGSLLEVLLGVGPGSRLWGLRATERLAYNVGTRTTWARGNGLLEAYLETENAKTGRAVAALDAVLASLLEKGVTADELRLTKSLARGHLLRSFEAKKPRAEKAGLWRLLGLGVDGLPAALEAIEAVTVQDLNAFIVEVLDPDRSLLVVVGGRGGHGL